MLDIASRKESKKDARRIDFYFDFVSPYGYLSAVQLDAMAKKYGRAVEWHPILLGVSVVQVMGLKPLMETPLKAEYISKDLPRLAQLYDVPLAIPKHGMPNPLAPARAVYWAKNHYPELATEFALNIYHAQWRDGHDISRPELLAQLAQGMGLDGASLLVALTTQELRQQLRDGVDASLSRGVFGSPTFIVDGEMIWGCDRMWMLEHWLAHGSWVSLAGSEMALQLSPGGR
jgi:2-hydroxychromene-2-carboxylate isomerase